MTLASGAAHATKISDMEDEIAALNARLDKVEEREENYRKDLDQHKRSDQDTALELKKNQADIKTDISSIRTELSQLEEVVRELSQKVNDLENKLTVLPQQGSTPVLTTAQAETVQTQVASAEEAPAPSPPAKVQAGKPAGAGAASDRLEKKTAGNEGYDLGAAYFDDGKFDAAQAQFEAFIKANPNSPLAEDAQFKIAECLYQQKDYKRAVIEYDKLQKAYPKSKKVPASLLKIGLCFEKLGKKDVAETTYKDLIATYPKSAEAAQAKALLNNLEKVKK
jgi:tol-pal system protein YbgF